MMMFRIQEVRSLDSHLHAAIKEKKDQENQAGGHAFIWVRWSESGSRSIKLKEKQSLADIFFFIIS